MAKTLYRDTGYTLTHLVEEIKHGRLALPDIQRPFVWKNTKARDLLDSMYRGYPIGTLMFWETGAEAGTRQIGESDAKRVARALIVDGQQRLTSLYAILTGQAVVTKTFEERRIRIAFCPKEERFEVTDAAIERDPEFIPDITNLWTEGYRSTERRFFEQLRASRELPMDQREEDELADRLDRVYDLRNFRFQVIELGSDASEEQVAEIFVRINSEGVKLNQADFILTLMSVHWEEGRAQLENFSRAALSSNSSGPSPRNPFLEPSPDQMLRVAVGLAYRRGRLQSIYKVLRGKDMVTGETSESLRTEQFDRLRRSQDQALNLSNWHEFLKCLTHAGFRSKRMLASENAVLFTYILWLIGRHDFQLEFRELRSVIARWFFMAHTTGRYTSSPESQLEQDLNRIANLESGEAFCAELDRNVKANFTRDYWEISLPNRLHSSSSRSPVLYAYWAALNLLDAQLLFSDLRIREMFDPAVSSPRSIERHHLFPRAFLAAQGITSRTEINQIANLAFLDWPENLHIGAKDPQQYWPLMKEKVEASRLAKQAEWHALPVGWEQLDYSSFLEKRRKLIADVVRKGYHQLWSTGETDKGEGTFADILLAGESQAVEFKSTARWNVRADRQDKKMEHIIVKSVCGFLNAEGGMLVIGVDDNGVPLGLENDFKTLGNKPDVDGYELFLRQLIDTNLSTPTARLVRIRFETVAEKPICAVAVSPSARPVFAKPFEGGQDATEFWVRVGNSTRQMHGDDMLRYQDDHWN